MRRLLSLALAAVMALGLALPVAATAPRKIKSLHPQFAQQLTLLELDGNALSPDGLENLTVHAGSELRIYLAGEEGDGRLFFDQDGASIPTADLTLSRLRAAQVEVSGSGDADDLLSSLDFAYGTDTPSSPCPYIQVHFTDEFFSVDPRSFTLPLTLRLAGEDQEQTALTLAGTMEPLEQEVMSGDTDLDLSDGIVAVAAESVSGITLNLGDGVTVVTDLAAGEKYYGVATLTLDEASEHSTDVRKVYELAALNLDTPESAVHIESENTLYVYSHDGSYIGTTRDALPYSGTYYLTNQKLEYFTA